MQRQQQRIQNVQSEGRAVAVTEAESLIDQKHDQYHFRSQCFRWLYYATRLAAGLAAGLLPFFVKSSPSVSTVLSIVVVISIVLDQVFAPREKWALYSKATDLLMLARLKATGEFAKYKDRLNVLREVESQSLAQLRDLPEVLAAVNRSMEPDE